MTPRKLTIIWDNRYFDAATLTPSSAAAGYPAAALQDQLRQRTWRTTGLNNQYLLADLGTPSNSEDVRPPVMVLVLVNHNLTRSAQVTLQAAPTTNFSEPLFTETQNAWPDIIGAGEGGAGVILAGGAIPDCQRAWYAPNPLSIIYLTSAPLEAKGFWKIGFNDPGNPDGYFQVGRIFLCFYDEYARKPGFGWGYSYQDDSAITRSVGGQPWTDRRQPYRVLRLPWKNFLNEDKYWRLAFFQQQVGLSRDFVIDAFPDARPSERFYTALYGRISGSASLPEISADENKYSSFELTVVESL